MDFQKKNVKNVFWNYAPQPLEISSHGIILGSKWQTSWKIAVVGCAGGDYTYLMFYCLSLPVCRKAADFKSCVDQLSCTPSDQYYVAYQSAVGIAVGDEYLCSAAARPGTNNTGV